MTNCQMMQNYLTFTNNTRLFLCQKKIIVLAYLSWKFKWAIFSLFVWRLSVHLPVCLFINFVYDSLKLIFSWLLMLRWAMCTCSLGVLFFNALLFFYMWIFLIVYIYTDPSFQCSPNNVLIIWNRHIRLFCRWFPNIYHKCFF